MARTRGYLAELVQRRLAGGDPSDDFQISLEEINAWIDFGMAAAAMKNYGDTVQFDTENVADGFYITVKNLPLTRDDETGEYVATLPSMPFALPFGYDIQSANIEGVGKLSQSMYRIKGAYLGYWQNLRQPPNRMAFYVEGSTIRVAGFAVLDGKKIRVRMAGGNSGQGLDEVLSCPDDLIPFVVDMVYSKIFPTLQIKQDLSNDGVNVQ